MKHTFYAVEVPGYDGFTCKAPTLKMLEKKIQQHFRRWKALQARDEDATVEDYMQGKMRVKVIIETL